MIEAFVNDLVAALGSNGGRALAEAAVAAIGRLTAGLRDKFRRDPAARGALEIVVDDPTDAKARERLAALITQRLERDADFSAWLRTEWELAERAFAQVDDAGANSVTGNVAGSVVQARDIHGGVNIGSPQAS